MSQDLGKKIKQTKKPQTTAKQKKKKKPLSFPNLHSVLGRTIITKEHQDITQSFLYPPRFLIF